jgi:hypothetical protein
MPLFFSTINNKHQTLPPPKITSLKNYQEIFSSYFFV